MLRRAKSLLGTLVEVACIGPHTDLQWQASQAAFAAVQRIHQVMSRHEASSELSSLNALTPGRWTLVGLDTLAVLVFAQTLSAQTGGIFDVFATSPVGSWKDLELDVPRQRVRKHAAMKADLGGVAKGYAVDQAVLALQRSGMVSGWVNAGGDLRVFGEHSVLLAVRTPWDLGQTVACTKLNNQAAATSASYLLPEVAIFHGVTRQAVPDSLSVTVAAPDCMSADALTKLVACTRNTHHPVLRALGASAWIYQRLGALTCAGLPAH